MWVNTMQIIIAFSYPKKFKIGAKFISWFLNKPYSHVLVYWYSKNLDRTLVYQASHGQVHFIEMDNFLKDNNIVKEFKLEVSEENFNKLIRKCVDLAGQPYAYLELITIGINSVLSKIGIKTQFKDIKGYVCSGIAAVVINEIFNKQLSKPVNLINPADIDEFLTTNI